MRLFIILLLLIPGVVSAASWGPFETVSLELAPGMDWSWRMNTTKPADTLELDCQSFFHHLHQNEAGFRKMSLMLETYECEAAQSKLHECFPIPGVACIVDQGLPEITCGPCR